jgi:hypothetical protein
MLSSEILLGGLFELRDFFVEAVVVEQFEDSPLFLLPIAWPLDGAEMAVIGYSDGLRPTIDSQRLNEVWPR